MKTNVKSLHKLLTIEAEASCVVLGGDSFLTLETKSDSQDGERISLMESFTLLSKDCKIISNS